MKKAIFTVFIVLMAVVVLAGCGGGKPAKIVGTTWESQNFEGSYISLKFIDKSTVIWIWTSDEYETQGKYSVEGNVITVFELEGDEDAIVPFTIEGKKLTSRWGSFTKK